MNISVDTTLTQRASVAVIASLWNQADIILDIKGFILEEPNFKLWDDIEDKVIFLFRDILVPRELQPVLNNLVQPMGMQILEWIYLTQPVFKMCPSLPKSMTFVWTEKGLLDNSKTTKLIIDSSSDHLLCFFLACIFCMEEIVRELWPHVKSYFDSKSYRDLKTLKLPKAVIYWTFYLRGEMDLLRWHKQRHFAARTSNEYEFGLFYLSDARCVSSLEYFMKFLPPEKRKEFIIPILRAMFSSQIALDGNVIVFLFSFLTECEISEMLEKNCFTVLSAVLVWPCHEHFMSIANSYWRRLGESDCHQLDSWWHSERASDFYELLINIVDFVSGYHVGNIYTTLFKQFWLSSPFDLRQYVKRNFLDLLMKLLSVKNTEEITRFMFSFLTPGERTRMIFTLGGMRLCDMLTVENNWNSLKLFVKNCIPDQCTLQAFIEENKKRNYLFRENNVRRRGEMYEKIKEWY